MSGPAMWTVHGLASFSSPSARQQSHSAVFLLYRFQTVNRQVHSQGLATSEMNDFSRLMRSLDAVSSSLYLSKQRFSAVVISLCCSLIVSLDSLSSCFNSAIRALAALSSRSSCAAKQAWTIPVSYHLVSSLVLGVSLMFCISC